MREHFRWPRRCRPGGESCDRTGAAINDDAGGLGRVERERSGGSCRPWLRAWSSRFPHAGRVGAIACRDAESDSPADHSVEPVVAVTHLELSSSSSESSFQLTHSHSWFEYVSPWQAESSHLHDDAVAEADPADDPIDVCLAPDLAQVHVSIVLKLAFRESDPRLQPTAAPERRVQRPGHDSHEDQDGEEPPARRDTGHPVKIHPVDAGHEGGHHADGDPR